MSSEKKLISIPPLDEYAVKWAEQLSFQIAFLEIWLREVDADLVLIDKAREQKLWLKARYEIMVKHLKETETHYLAFKSRDEEKEIPF